MHKYLGFLNDKEIQWTYLDRTYAAKVAANQAEKFIAVEEVFSPEECVQLINNIEWKAIFSDKTFARLTATLQKDGVAIKVSEIEC